MHARSTKGSSENSLGRIAWLYYDQGMSQQEIADFVGVSRLTINRSLKEARESGIIEFRIHEKHLRCFEVEEQLRQATGLSAVTVIPSGPDVIGSLGSAAVPRFKEALATCKSIALGGGRTISMMVRRLPKVKKIVTEHMVSMGEFVHNDTVYDPETIAHLITTKLNIRCHRIDALSLETPLEVVNAIRETPAVAKAIQMARDSDIAFSSACDIEASDTIFYGPMSESLRRELVEAGVIGEIEGTLYTLAGKAYESDYSLRECVPLPMKCPVVLVAGGVHKVNAIVGAIRGSFIDELVTDRQAATRILEFF